MFQKPAGTDKAFLKPIRRKPLKCRNRKMNINKKLYRSDKAVFLIKNNKNNKIEYPE